MDILIYQGSHSFDSLNNVPHSSIRTLALQILLTVLSCRSQFDYSYEQKCISTIMYVTFDIEGTCSLENSIHFVFATKYVELHLIHAQIGTIS